MRIRALMTRPIIVGFGKAIVTKGGDTEMRLKTIKQARGSKDSLACVAAMATETSQEEYIGFCVHGKLDRFSDRAMVEYLYTYGYAVGMFVEEGHYWKIEQLGIMNIMGVPAYMVVESSKEHIRRKGGTHAVYWDGERIHDPNPDASFTDSDYKISSVLPIVKIENHERWKRKKKLDKILDTQTTAMYSQ